MKTIEAVELFNIVKDLKLSGMETGDRMKVIRLTRSLRGVSDKYTADIDQAKNQLKPEGFDILVTKRLESNEAVAGGGTRTMTDLEVATFNRMLEQYNRDMQEFQQGTFNKETNAFEGGINDEEADVAFETISEQAFDKLLEANKELQAGALAVLYDKIVKHS